MASVQTALADSDEDRIARLEMRIRELEARLERAEKKASELAGAKITGTGKTTVKKSASGPPHTANAPTSASEAKNAESGSQKPPAWDPAKESASNPPPVQAGAPAPSDAEVGPEKRAARELTPSEFNVFRDNAATLSQHNWEFAFGAAYQKRSSAIQSDRAALGFLNIRYGVMDGVEASLNIPYYYASRSTQTSPSNTYVDNRSGIGDISAQISAIAIKETADWPALVATARILAPTGQSPISFSGSYLVSGNPIDPLVNYQTTGNWIPGVAAQIYKTLSPMIVFAGVGINYPISQYIQGHYIQYPPQFTYNMGFAFAVTEKTTFGIQVNGSYQGNFWVDGVEVQQSEQEPIFGRFVLVQRIGRDTYLEPNVAFGLSKDSPDALIGLTLRHRY